MELEPHVSSALLLLALLNPFLLSACLREPAAGLPRAAFLRSLACDALVSALVFSLCAWGGDAIFSDVLQVRFASFQAFCGVIFLAIALRLVFKGADAMRALGGPLGRLSGAIALPLMIGPGTVSASLVVGARLPVPEAIAVILVALAAAAGMVAAIRRARDALQERNALLLDRYVEIAGRVAALLTGTFAMEMIFEGIGSWLEDPAPQWRA
jgi:small neutral amino acid transporter SnatA (MarC family)